MPTYWSRLFKYIYDNSEDWEWDPQLFYDTFEYLISQIKENLADEEDEDVLEFIENFGEKMFLTHFQVGLYIFSSCDPFETM